MPAAAAPWIACPIAARAQTTEVVLQNVKLGSGLLSFEAPRVIVRGTRLSHADLTRLLDPASPEPVMDRVMRIEADEIFVPELINAFETAQVKQRTVYRDVSYRTIAGGKIASFSSSGATQEGTAQGETMRGSMGRITADDIDLAATIHAFAGKAVPGEALRRLQGAYVIEDIVSEDSRGFKSRVGRMSGTEMLARPLKSGWAGMMDVFAAAEANKGDPEAGRKAIEAVLDMSESISMGDVEARDVSIDGRLPNEDMQFGGRIARVAYTAPKGGRGGEFAAEGLDFGNKDGRVKYDRVAFGGLDMKPILAFFREIGTDPTKSPDIATLRNLTTVISSIKLEGLDVDISPKAASMNTRDAGGDRVRASLGRFALDVEKPINGIPTDIRFSIGNLSAPLPPNPSDPGLMTVAQMGYDRIDGSLGLGLSWNEATQEIAIRELTLDGRDMGSISIRAMLGNVVRDLFDLDTAVASVALTGATAKSLDIAIDNRGLFERFVAMQARKQKRSPEDLRREYGTMAAVGIPAILGNGPSAKALAQSVARFVARPGKLTIQAKARQSGGFGVADFAANPTPAGVLEALDIKATAE